MDEWKDLKAAQKELHLVVQKVDKKVYVLVFALAENQDYDLAVWMAVLMVDMKGMISALKWVYYQALTWAEYWV